MKNISGNGDWNMSGEVIWELIKKQLENNELEFKTKRNLWFSAIYMDNKIYIDKAKNDEPSCKVNMIRPISKDEFILVYSFYHRWINKEPGIFDKAGKKFMNVSYIFALISNYSN